MLVCKHFLVPRAQITYLLMMYSPNMAMQVRPAEACNVAIPIRAIVPQEKDSIFHDLTLLIAYAIIHVCAGNVRICKVFIAFRGIVCENHKRC